MKKLFLLISLLTFSQQALALRLEPGYSADDSDDPYYQRIYGFCSTLPMDMNNCMNTLLNVDPCYCPTIDVEKLRDACLNIAKRMHLHCNTLQQKPIAAEKESDEACIANCGNGYFYDAIASEKLSGIVCTRYPKKCGYSCTYGWLTTTSDTDSNYTCRKAKQ